MRKHITKLASLFIVAALIFIACQKTSTVQTETEQVETSLNAGKTAGQVHNEMLDVLAAQGGFPAISSSQAFTVLAGYLKMDNPETAGLEMEKSFTARTRAQSARGESDFLGKFTAQAMTELRQSASAADFAEKAKDIAQAIREDVSLTQIEKTAYLNTLSVLQSSFEYWEEVVKNNNHSWHSLFMSRYEKPGSDNVQTDVADQGPCAGLFGMDFMYCVIAVDARNYRDAFDYIYKEYPDGTNNYAYANTQATAQGAYASGRAGGAGMIID